MSSLNRRLNEAIVLYTKCSLYASGHLSSPPAPSVSQAGQPAARDVIAYVTALYSEACAQLISRHIEVLKLYISRRQKARSYQIENPDRNLSSIADSGRHLNDIVVTTVTDLLAEIQNLQTPIPTLQNKCFPLWDLLKATAGLLMEEITFLSKRIDEIQQLINAIDDRGTTIATLKVAAWTLGATVVVGIISGVIAWCAWRYPIPFDPSNVPVPYNDSEIQNKMDDINKNLSSIKTAITGQTESEGNNFSTTVTTITSERKQLSGDLNAILVAINALPRQGQDTVALEATIKDLQDRMSILEAEIQTSSSNSAQNLKAIISEFEDLKILLESIKKTINQKPVQINKKQIGVLNINSH